ncbi:ester cyclase [Nocardioides iriomotensis]|nr:ester cyclase [Nocardioides iriomotensis]
MGRENEDLLHEFMAAFAAGDDGTLRRLVHADIVDHTPPPGAAPGIDGLLYAVAGYRQGFPDLRISLEKVVADGQDVVGYGRIKGTHSGSFFGQEPTGRAVDFGYIDIYRVRDGKLADAWHLEDIAGLTRQIAATGLERSA